LVQALLQPEGPGRTNLVGVHRTRYQELARLELTGVAAHPWQTPSGFIGLTALYWDQRGQSWVSWSDARPLVQAAGFDPLKRFRMNGPWEGVSSPEETVLNKIVLVNPKRNPDGRLSSSTSTKAMVLEPVRPSEIDFGSRLFSDWGALRSYVAGVFPLGLRETHPLDLVVVIQPHRFGPRSFDEQRQLFRWEVRDRAGASFLLAIPYSPWTKQAIKCLEELEVSDKEQWRIVSKITSSETGLVAEPLTLHKLQPGQEKLIHLAFTDDSSAKSGSHSLVKTLLDVFRDDGDEWDEVAASDGHVPAHLDRVITKIEREVERAAESGADSLNWPLLESMQRECERLSLMPLAQSMKENRRTCSRALLGIRYTSSLYRQSASFA
jgi:hypothetical protein